MRYFICGLTINGAYFWVNDLYEHQIEDEKNKIISTIAYFGGGSVTVYAMDYKNDVTVKSFENVNGDNRNRVDNVFMDR